MEGANPLTGLRKRQQIRTANKTVFAWIIAASIVVGICGVVSEFLIRQLLFNNTIYGILTSTSTTLDKNIKAYDALKLEVTKLVANSNLNALRKGGNSTALQVIIDALPTEENRAAFATSMQKEVLGPSSVTINSFSIIDGSSSATTTGVVTGTNASSFDCSFSITGSYTQVMQAVHNMERSIRPITIQSIDLQGTDAQMQANITATTYYQPAKNVALKEETKKP